MPNTFGDLFFSSCPVSLSFAWVFSKKMFCSTVAVFIISFISSSLDMVFALMPRQRFEWGLKLPFNDPTSFYALLICSLLYFMLYSLYCSLFFLLFSHTLWATFCSLTYSNFPDAVALSVHCIYAALFSSVAILHSSLNHPLWSGFGW